MFNKLRKKNKNVFIKLPRIVNSYAIKDYRYPKQRPTKLNGVSKLSTCTPALSGML